MIAKHLSQALSQVLPANFSSNTLLKGSIGSLGLKVINTVAVFVYSLLLARVLSVKDYGLYEYVMAWMMLLSVPAVFGLDKFMVREVSSLAAQRHWSRLRGLIAWSFTMVLGTSALVIAILGALAWWRSGQGNSQLSLLFWIGCIFLPATALMTTAEGFLKGLHHITIGQLPTLFVRPITAISLFGGVVLFSTIEVNTRVALFVYMAAVLTAFLVSFFLMIRKLPPQLKGLASDYAMGAWTRHSVPLMINTSLYMLNSRVGVLVLGSIGQPEAAGVYAIALKVSDLVAFVLVAVSVALAPTFSKLYTERNSQELQRTYTRSTQLIFLVSLPIVLGLVVLGQWLLGIFGAAYVSGYGPLLVLALGQVIALAVGPVGILLTMTNFEQYAVLGFSVGVVVNIALCLILAPTMGVMGAAVAATVSALVWNTVLALITFQKLELFVSIFQRPRSQ